MNSKEHILNASGSLSPFLIDIQKVFLKAVEKAENVLPIKNLDIVIWDYPDWTIEEYGMGGHTLSPHLVAISIDPNNPNSRTMFQEHLEQTILHELHHVARQQALGDGIANRLEVSISEGLADHFVIELTGTKPAPWSTGLNKNELDKYSQIAIEDRSTDYWIDEWLFGSNKNDIPKWTGYAVGFYLVGDYLQKNSEQKTSLLYNKLAEEFIS